jgi:hypothetical protein
MSWIVMMRENWSCWLIYIPNTSLLELYALSSTLKRVRLSNLNTSSPASKQVEIFLYLHPTLLHLLYSAYLSLYYLTYLL